MLWRLLIVCHCTGFIVEKRCRSSITSRKNKKKKIAWTTKLKNVISETGPNPSCDGAWSWRSRVPWHCQIISQTPARLNDHSREEFINFIVMTFMFHREAYYCFRNRISETRLLFGTLLLQLCVESHGKCRDLFFVYFRDTSCRKRHKPPGKRGPYHFSTQFLKLL